jgi:hypothetical protein
MVLEVHPDHLMHDLDFPTKDCINYLGVGKAINGSGKVWWSQNPPSMTPMIFGYARPQ